MAHQTELRINLSIRLQLFQSKKWIISLNHLSMVVVIDKTKKSLESVCSVWVLRVCLLVFEHKFKIHRLKATSNSNTFISLSVSYKHSLLFRYCAHIDNRRKHTHIRSCLESSFYHIWQWTLGPNAVFPVSFLRGLSRNQRKIQILWTENFLTASQSYY